MNRRAFFATVAAVVLTKPKAPPLWIDEELATPRTFTWKSYVGGPVWFTILTYRYSNCRVDRFLLHGATP